MSKFLRKPATLLDAAPLQDAAPKAGTVRFTMTLETDIASSADAMAREDSRSRASLIRHLLIEEAKRREAGR